MMLGSILFDDTGRGGGSHGCLLSPLTDLRPTFAIRTGALTTRQRLRRTLQAEVRALWVRPEHEAMAKSRPGEPCVNALPSDGAGEWLLINGRASVCPTKDEIENLRAGEALIEGGEHAGIIAMRASRVDLEKLLSDGSGVEQGRWPEPGGTVHARDHGFKGMGALITRPWHVRTARDHAIHHDLKLLVEQIGAGSVPKGGLGAGVTVFGSHALSIHPNAKIYPGVIIDVEQGAVVIDEHAVIRPGVSLIGPCYVGAHSTVLDKALIKGQTAIGEHCKVAGEVGGTIFHGFANKAHDGHLGDAWIGKWSNLGAGTTNSNLLNTYAEVTMRATPASSMERTGQQFMGCVVGDHVKTAICTRIMTGTIVNTGAMIAQTAPISGTVRAFSWCTDEAPAGCEKPRSFRCDKFIEIARTVMSRRKVEMGPAYVEAVKALHARSGSGAS